MHAVTLLLGLPSTPFLLHCKLVPTQVGKAKATLCARRISLLESKITFFWLPIALFRSVNTLPWFYSHNVVQTLALKKLFSPYMSYLFGLGKEGYDFVLLLWHRTIKVVLTTHALFIWFPNLWRRRMVVLVYYLKRVLL